MNNRLSQKEVDDILEKVESISAGSLSPVQSTAFNYLIDYLELGYDGINSSHEGERLFNLCIDIMNDFLDKRDHEKNS